MSVSLKHTSDVDGDRDIDRNTVHPYLIERGGDIDRDIDRNTANPYLIERGRHADSDVDCGTTNPSLIGTRTDAWFSWPWYKKDKGTSLSRQLDALKSVKAVHQEFNRQQKELKRQTDLAAETRRKFLRNRRTAKSRYLK
jgi:hypothetical protein